jgi:tyrosine-specific transport protein
MDKKDNRLLGGVLLVGGTATGAGMLAIPAATAFGGFIPSLFVFIICWLLMLVTAFFFLDVTLSIRGEPNLVSMAGRTLGTWGKAFSWIFFLLLLYVLVAAYISGCTPLFESAFLNAFQITFPKWFAPFVLPFLFGGFVYLGTKGVDYLNRFFMIGLVASYFLLTGSCASFVEPPRFMHQDYVASIIAFPIVLASFGYHIIIPTLSTYMHHDVKRLKKTLIFGSLIPFVIYLVWQWIVQGSVSQFELVRAWKQGAPATVPLEQATSLQWIKAMAQFFSFFAIITSFLGVSLSLSDFITDGLKIKKTWEGRLGVICLTFVPPVIFVLTWQKGFYLALEYAGVLVAILLGIFPALMVLKLKRRPFYRKKRGRLLVYTVIVLCVGIIAINFLSNSGLLDSLTTPYLR